MSGVVEKVFINTRNHNYKTVEIFNNNETSLVVVLDRDYSGLFEYLIPGDSIYKNENNREVIIIRNDTTATFILDFGCK